MKTWRHYLPSPRATILLLIVSLLCLTIFQLHVHVHSASTHDAYHANQQDHDHFVAAGFLTELHDLDQHHEGIVDAKPTGLLVKQVAEDNFLFVLALLFSLLLIRRFNHALTVIRPHQNQHYHHRYWYVSPQLRAPPK